MKKTLVGLLVIGFVAAAGLADQADVFLKDGRRLRGDVTETATHVIIKTAAGEMTIAKADVLRVVRRTTPDDQYKNKVSVLKPDDLDGHFVVAEWAASLERWDLVIRQCTYILGLKRDHRNAKLLLEQARTKQAETANEAAAEDESKTDPDDPKAEAKPGATVYAPLLSKSDIQRMKINELSLLAGGEGKIRAKFTRKRKQTDLAREFVKEMEGQEGYDDRWKRKFLRMTTSEQVIDIVGATGLKYADRIELAGDPEVFSTYRRRVMPMIVRSCAKSGCHGNSGRGFAFPKGSRQSEAFAYTTFLLLDSMNSEYGPMINRDDPHASALLGFMLPQDESDQPHPEVKRGGPRYTTVLKSRSDRNFITVLDWISSLALPRPDYKLEYKLPETIKTIPPPEPIEPPADEPDEKPPTSKPAEEKPAAKKDDDKP